MIKTLSYLMKFRDWRSLGIGALAGLAVAFVIVSLTVAPSASLSIDTIERDYHHDAALPKPAHEGNRALCYQMKDLLVHPLTALRLLREQPVDVDSIRHEIVEVIAHGRALAALMNAGGT